MTTLDMHFKDDLANILRGIAAAGNIGECSKDFQEGFNAALVSVATALGIVEIDLQHLPRQPRSANANTPQVVLVDPCNLSAANRERYRFSGRRSDTGYLDAIDTRTGRRGATDEYGYNFEPGLIVRDDGRTEYEHPWDNPLQGCRW